MKHAWLAGVLLSALSCIPAAQADHVFCTFTAEFDAEHSRYEYIGQGKNPIGVAYTFVVHFNEAEPMPALRKIGLALADEVRSSAIDPWNPRYRNETVRCQLRRAPNSSDVFFAAYEEALAIADKYRAEGWDSDGAVNKALWWDYDTDGPKKVLPPLNSDWRGPTAYEGPK